MTTLLIALYLISTTILAVQYVHRELFPDELEYACAFLFGWILTPILLIGVLVASVANFLSRIGGK